MKTDLMDRKKTLRLGPTANRRSLTEKIVIPHNQYVVRLQSHAVTNPGGNGNHIGQSNGHIGLTERIIAPRDTTVPFDFSARL